MKRENHSKYLLLTGFSLVLGLLLALMLSALLRMQTLERHMTEIVEVHNAKIEYARAMYDAARERALGLSTMLLTDDPFVRDDAYMAFIERAADFINARIKYRALEMGADEQQTLELANERSAAAHKVQARAIELLMAERHAEANHYLLEQAMPAQLGVLEALDTLVSLQKQLSGDAIAQARQVYLRGYWLVLALGVTALSLGLLIAWFVVSRISGVENLLRHARDAAEEAARIKSDFLANMSHEIRTPLNAVLGMSELLQGTGLNTQQQDYVDTIQTSGSALISVINDILDFSKIEAGMLELEKQPFDLRRCIEEALDLQAGKADEKGLELIYYIAPDIYPGGLGDLARLRQVLLNLVGNAVKFTSRGEIVVRVHSLPAGQDSSERRLHVSVSDTGIGIPPALVHKLFTPFTQADTSSARKFGGTGLGLVICKRLCELMGGKIWVESSEGQGSIFHFTIVLPEAELTGIRCQVEKTLLRGKRALLVDDNAACREILYNQLQDWGLRVEAFATGASALASLWRGAAEYDLALVDMHMSNMDGLALAGKIREYKNSRQLPMILLSRVSKPPQPSELFQAYVSKPVKFCQLLEHLAVLFGGELAAAQAVTAIDRLDASLGLRAPLHILLAEDNQVNQKVALLMLQKLGYTADLAKNGIEALEAVGRRAYDLVLMDVQMPEMGGLEAARRIRESQAQARQPMIIAMTANVLPEDVQKCLAAGMDSHIGKPVQTRDLAKVLERCYHERYPEGQAHARQAPLIDLAVFNELRNLLGGDPLAMKDLIDTYIQDAPRFLRALEQAIAAQDGGKLANAVKPLKSSSASLGAHTLARLCGDLEEIARIGRLQGIGSQFKAVETELAEVTAALPGLLVSALPASDRSA